MERALRGIAGSFILIALVLVHFVSAYWLWFIVFIGANLLQSAFTNWCPMMNILAFFGLKPEERLPEIKSLSST